MTIAGISGGARKGAAALVDNGVLTAVCAQERVTRVRDAGLNPTGLPDEALDLLLHRRRQSRAVVQRYAVAEGDGPHPIGVSERLDHARAHAATAFLTSPFESAVILVCDHDAPEVSVWAGDGSTIRPAGAPWSGPGFARVFSQCAAVLGFSGPTAEPRLEALARLRPDSRDAVLDGLISRNGDAVVAEPSLGSTVTARVAGETGTGGPAHAAVAAALQARLAELLVELVRELRAAHPASRLCLGGSLFNLSSMNTAVRGAGVFDEVFTPIDPGNSGLAVGAALLAAGSAPALASPFLGPSYGSEEIKQTLDNCKLHYDWASEEEAVQTAVRALQDGRLVGWFDGAMEWGPRALGARCILANPTARYVLDNLNTFLKHREPWRGYALSGLGHAVAEHFDGPVAAPYMECDYRPRDPGRIREALPLAEASVRVQTVTTANTPPRFHRLLEAFGEVSGLPLLINTSFNGFHEPIVCSPRDAVRVFYATGLDVLVIGQFVLSK